MAQKRAQQANKPLRVLFQDEARFGRMNKPTRCWSVHPLRPEAPQQLIREYTYAYATVDPLRGSIQSAMLPHMTTYCMSVFLRQVARSYRKEEVLLFCDQAASHRAKTLTIPKNIRLHPLPPYSPQLNPVEHLWDEIREKYFPNRLFDSMDQLEDHLCDALRSMHSKRKYTKSLCGFSWLINCILKAN